MLHSNTLHKNSSLNYVTEMVRVLFYGSHDLRLQFAGTLFVKVCGIGAGAGLLQEKNLLSLITQMTPKNTPTKSTVTEEELKELEDLMQKIDRLQSLGVLKVMNKEDK